MAPAAKRVMGLPATLAVLPPWLPRPATVAPPPPVAVPGRRAGLPSPLPASLPSAAASAFHAPARVIVPCSGMSSENTGESTAATLSGQMTGLCSTCCASPSLLLGVCSPSPDLSPVLPTPRPCVASSGMACRAVDPRAPSCALAEDERPESTSTSAPGPPCAAAPRRAPPAATTPAPSLLLAPAHATAPAASSSPPLVPPARPPPLAAALSGLGPACPVISMLSSSLSDPSPP